MMSSKSFMSPWRAGSISKQHHDEPNDKDAHLEYRLNFLSTTSHWKCNQWTPASVTTDDIAATKKSVKSFLDHLASQMDHTVSQWCQIYQLEDVWSKPGETLDELVDHLRALADRYNAPTDEVKEPNVQFHLVCALTYSEITHHWPQGQNSQDAQNMQDSHSCSRQPQCYGPLIPNC